MFGHYGFEFVSITRNELIVCLLLSTCIQNNDRLFDALTALLIFFIQERLYAEAGADASFVEAPRNDDELKEIGRQTRGYRVCNMLEGGATPLHTPEELKGMGFHLIVHPLTTLYASARALIDILKSLKEKGTTRDHLHQLATFEEFNQLVGLESWFELEARYSQSKDNSTSKS
eukprot:Gb_07232 [translate_table: standard]